MGLLGSDDREDPGLDGDKIGRWADFCPPREDDQSALPSCALVFSVGKIRQNALFVKKEE